MAEIETNPLRRPLPDGVVPEEEITRTEDHWLAIMLGVLGVMMGVMVVSAATNALHPPSNVETIDPATLHLGGEFAESNLGTAIEPDGSVTVRMIAEQYDFIPNCAQVPVDTPVKFRLTSPDVIHGFLITDTNVNTMVVPGFIAEVRTRFDKPRDHLMPCHEYCSVGHEGMWAHVRVVDRQEFTKSYGSQPRASCAG